MMSDPQPEPSPYTARDHNVETPIDRTDVLSMAQLLGHVSGSLKEIDDKIIEKSEYSRALKMDPKQTLMKLTGGATPTTPHVQPGVVSPDQILAPESIQQPHVPESIQQPHVQTNSQTTAIDQSVLLRLTERIDRLEQKINNRKLKFKRGISYNINTTNIKGTFRDYNDIVDVVASEIMKQTKTITLRLNDSNKNTK